MPKIDVPDEKEEQILRENGMDPHKYCVTHRSEDMICLRNYKTRDDITIHKVLPFLSFCFYSKRPERRMQQI